MEHWHTWFTILGLSVDILGVVILFRNWLPNILALARRNLSATHNRMLKQIRNDREMIRRHEGRRSATQSRPSRRWSDLILAIMKTNQWFVARAMRNQLRNEGVQVTSLLGDDGLIDEGRMNAAVEEAIGKMQFDPEQYEPWEPPILGLRLILLGFVLQIIGAWP